MSGEISRDIIGAMTVGPRAKPARTFPSGRTCRKPGCGVRLSVYNPSSVCGLSMPISRPWRTWFGLTAKGTPAGSRCFVH